MKLALDSRLRVGLAAAAVFAFVIAVLATLGRMGAVAPRQLEESRVVDRNHAPPNVEPSSSSLSSSTSISAPTSSANAVVASDSKGLHFRGRLIYDSTRQPVPWCAVAVRAPSGATESCTTDADGRFATVRTFAPGQLELLACDVPAPTGSWSASQKIELDSGLELEIAVAMWPTVIVDGGLPESVGATDAVCRFRPFEDFTLRVVAPNIWFWRLQGPQRRDDRALLDSLVGAGPCSFTVEATAHDRLGSERVDETQDLRAVDDGRWIGSGTVDRLDGIVHVALDWKRRTALAVSLKVPVSLSVGTVDAELRELGVRNARSFVQTASLLGGGSLEFDDLAPGEYALSLTSDFCESVERRATVLEGELAQMDVVLDCTPDGGSIGGEVVSESGGFHDRNARVSLCLADPAGSELATKQVFWRQVGSRWVGRYEFIHLPEHAYTVAMVADPCAVQPQGWIPAHPRDRVDFTVLDAAPGIDLGFRVFEAGTGRAIDAFTVDEFHSGERASSIPATSGAIAVRGLPLNGQCKWRIAATGHACTTIELADVAKTWTVDGNRRWVRIELQPGARLAIEARAVRSDGLDRSAKQLGGAVVVLDGAESGVTDTRGRFEATLAQSPASIEVRYRDWPVWSSPSERDRSSSCEELTFFFLQP